MNDKKSTDARREHLDRHTRIGVMLDQLATAWDVCLFDAESGQYDNVDKAAKDELVDELRWLRVPRAQHHPRVPPEPRTRPSPRRR